MNDPKTLDDCLISNPMSRKRLQEILDGIMPFPKGDMNAICLCGTYGTGKTTLAKLLPALLEASGHMKKITDAGGILKFRDLWHLTQCGGTSSAELLESLTTRIKTFAQSDSGWHYEIFDEIDVLDKARGQSKLKSAMTHAENTVFIFTTNFPDRVDQGILDRSHLIEMNQANANDFVMMAESWLLREGLPAGAVERAALLTLADQARGSLRKFSTEVEAAANRYRRSVQRGDCTGMS